MRVRSGIIRDAKLVEEVVAAVKQFADRLREAVGAEYPITEVRVDLEEGKVFVVWKDYSEEEKRAEELIREYLELRSKLTDPLKQPSLLARIIEIAAEFMRLTGLNIEEVVGQWRS